jgi:hypothetical protein
MSEFPGREMVGASTWGWAWGPAASEACRRSALLIWGGMPVEAEMSEASVVPEPACCAASCPLPSGCRRTRVAR